MSSILNQTYDFIALREQQDILNITLNRPTKKNAMSIAMMRELIDVAHRIKKDKQIRAVIITGHGSAFCAGIDLSDLTDPKNAIMGLWELIKPTQSLFQKACLIWRDVPVPVIASLHGYCLAQFCVLRDVAQLSVRVVRRRRVIAHEVAMKLFLPFPHLLHPLFDEELVG